MNIIDSQEFSKITGNYSGSLIINIFKSFNIEYYPLTCLEYEICDKANNICSRKSWNSTLVTVVYTPDINSDIVMCVVINRVLSELINLFNKTKQLKAFL